MGMYSKESLVGLLPGGDIQVGKEAFSPEEFVGLVVQTLSKAIDGREELIDLLISSLPDEGDLILKDLGGGKNMLQHIRSALEFEDVYIQTVNDKPEVFYRNLTTPKKKSF